MSSIVRKHVAYIMGGMKGYMTLTEMAELLKLKSPDSLRMQIKKGVLKAEKVGAGAHAIWMIADEDVKTYIEERAGKRGFASPDHPQNKKGSDA